MADAIMRHLLCTIIRRCHIETALALPLLQYQRSCVGYRARRTCVGKPSEEALPALLMAHPAPRIRHTPATKGAWKRRTMFLLLGTCPHGVLRRQRILDDIRIGASRVKNALERKASCTRRRGWLVSRYVSRR